MSDIFSQAASAAREFIDFGDHVVKAVRSKIEQHVSSTLPVTTLAVAIGILIRQKPKTMQLFLTEFEESMGYAFPSAVAARELWSWAGPKEDVATQAAHAAQKFRDLGERVVQAVEAKIKQHATTTVPVTAIAVAINVLLRRDPKSFKQFLSFYEEAAGVAFPSGIAANELWSWVNPPK